MSATGIYGLSGSGIDVDSMVKVGMMTKQSQYDKIYKQEVKNEWKKEAYSDLYKSINTFNTTTLSGYNRSSKTSPMLASSSKEDVVTAVANADAASMTHTVTVSSLASNAYLQTGDDGIKRSSNTKSKSIYLKDVIYSGSELSTMESSYNYLSDDKKSQIALSFTLSDGKSGGSDTNSTTISFTYKDLFDSQVTLNDLASKINTAGVNVQASYDSVNDSFSLYQKTGGADNQINLTVENLTDDTTKNGKSYSPESDNLARTLLNNLHLSKVETAADGTQSLSKTLISFTDGATETISTEGVDGEAIIDGKSYKTTSTKLSVANVTYSLASKGTSSVTVSQDTDALVENVKSFVEDYNKMLDSLNDKYYETQYSDYDVLTKSQEGKMTQEQITKWNDKAKSGLLYHDQTLGKIISSMREALYTPVTSVSNDKYNTMMSIGITSSTDQGHITLDETKLRKALAEDPSAVRELFSNTGDVTSSSGETTTDYNQEGVLNRVSDALYTNLKTMKTYAGTSTESGDGSTLGTLIENLKTQMSDFKTQMDAFEEALYSKYDAMETAIQQLSVQMGYVSGSTS